MARDLQSRSRVRKRLDLRKWQRCAPDRILGAPALAAHGGRVDPRHLPLGASATGRDAGAARERARRPLSESAGPREAGHARHGKHRVRVRGGLGLLVRGEAGSGLGLDRLRSRQRSGVAHQVHGAGYNFSFDWPAYWRGITSIYVDLAPAYPNDLLGEFSTDPWWYYHLAALGFKVPVPTLLLLVFAAVTAWADRTRRGADVFLLVPVLVVLGASCFDHVNLGVRRVLPALPFLFLFAGRLLSGEVRLRTLRLIVASLMIAWMAAEALRIYPHHLAYFNSIVGGPERGASYLDDSNIDWGQDLPALAAWQEGEPAARRLRLRYFGSASPAAYGVESVDFSTQELMHPKPGYYAISVQNLIRFELRPQQAGPVVDWLHRYEPIAKAGHSIYIYHFPEP